MSVQPPKKLRFNGAGAGRGGRRVEADLHVPVGEVRLAEPKAEAAYQLAERYRKRGAKVHVEVGRAEELPEWVDPALPIVLAPDDLHSIEQIVEANANEVPLTLGQGLLRSTAAETAEVPYAVSMAVAKGRPDQVEQVLSLVRALRAVAPPQSSSRMRTSPLAAHRMEALRSRASQATVRNLLEPGLVQDRETGAELFAFQEAYPIVLRSREGETGAALREQAFDAVRERSAAVAFLSEGRIDLLLVGVTRAGSKILRAWLPFAAPPPELERTVARRMSMVVTSYSSLREPRQPLLAAFTD